jgi:hypothetical protein
MPSEDRGVNVGGRNGDGRRRVEFPALRCDVRGACTHAQGASGTVLVGDIGGTNARLSIWKSDAVSHTSAEVYAKVQQRAAVLSVHTDLSIFHSACARY